MNPDLLSQLRDIHAAPAVPWWPPAPGWWVLALLSVAVLAWLGYRVVLRYRLHQRRRQMLAWVEYLDSTVDPQRDPQSYLAVLNRIFKLIALRAFPEAKCAAMTGEQWSEFLRTKIKSRQPTGELSVMAQGPYNPAVNFDPATLRSLVQHWIRHYG